MKRYGSRFVAPKQRFGPKILSLLATPLLLLSADIVSASSFVPDYSGAPNSVSASWSSLPDPRASDPFPVELATDAILGAGSTYQLSEQFVNSGCGGGNLDLGEACLTGVFEGDAPAPGGGNAPIYTYTALMPNVVDDLPLKEMRIHGEITVVNDLGSDPFIYFTNLIVDAFNDGIKVPEEDIFELDFGYNDAGDSDLSTFDFFFDYLILPNPDFEIVAVQMQGAYLSELTMDTVSAVPIPAAAWLFASALGVFGYAGWRRKTA